MLLSVPRSSFLTLGTKKGQTNAIHDHIGSRASIRTLRLDHRTLLAPTRMVREVTIAHRKGIS
jgi:hypothetical protein